MTEVEIRMEKLKDGKEADKDDVIREMIEL